MNAFKDALNVFETNEAGRFAGALFQESFNSALPTPTAMRILDAQIQPEHWRQFVAVYTWPDGTDECVGFCNWIKYKDVYLEGGLAVQKNFYRRLPKPHFTECAARGGIAQIIMDTAAAILTNLGNDHVAFREDLRLLTTLGWQIVPVTTLVQSLGSPEATWPDKCEAITFDDGTNFDFEDLPHPVAAVQRSMLNIMRDFVAANPGA